MILKVIKYPDPILSKKSLPVDKIDEEVKKLAQDMVETMAAENGIGISAVQVGVIKRIMVVSVKRGSFDDKLYPEIMINPKIVSRDGFQCLNEGCLSFPGLFLPVNRYDILEIEYQDLEGDTKRGILQGLESVCFQHELDHLNGIVFVNKGQSKSLAGRIR